MVTLFETVTLFEPTGILYAQQNTKYHVVDRIKSQSSMELQNFRSIYQQAYNIVVFRLIFRPFPVDIFKPDRSNKFRVM